MRKLNKKAMTNLVPMALTIVIAFALLFIGGYVNGTIHDELDGSVDNDDARSTMNNTSTNFDSALDIVQVVIIITVLAGAVGAIFLFTRFQ
jgi:hypothetical protein